MLWSDEVDGGKAQAEFFLIGRVKIGSDRYVAMVVAEFVNPSYLVLSLINCNERNIQAVKRLGFCRQIVITNSVFSLNLFLI